MNPEQIDMLIRVDQNVINLVKLFDAHLTDDKSYQLSNNERINSLETARAEARGMARLGTIVYGMLGGIASLIGGYFLTKA